MERSILEAFLQIPYGIYVLASAQNAGPRAMVVSWVSQVSYSPPLLLVALRKNRPVIPAILGQNIFSLNLLKKEQIAWVDRFKRRVRGACRLGGKGQTSHHLRLREKLCRPNLRGENETQRNRRQSD
ncbi:MAG: NAD(P)H-flavin oxidoreductase [Deltaproteobacteria bacterium]|nr:NAD(P)H-flavin oxidoreductase [Deltaproteobacteria bacterium]